MKDFLKTVFAVWIGLILFTVFGTGITIFFLVGLGSKIEETSGKLEDNSILVYDLSLFVTDRPQDNSSLSVALEETSTISLRSLLEAVESAATDDQIKGLYLTTTQGFTGAGYSSLKEIREALAKFKESGKPILAYSTDWSEPDYYLASIADQVILNPVGSLALDGLRSEVQFYGGALQKYGVGMQVVRVGKYKSAVEPYTEKQFSAANREQLQLLLGDLWQEVLKTVESDRSIKVTQLQTLSQEQGILMPEMAKQQGLVDEIQHLDQVQTQLRGWVGLEEIASTDSPDSVAGELEPDSENSEESELDLPLIDVVNYSRHLANTPVANDSDYQIAIVYAEGTIISGEGDRGVIGSDEYVELLQDLRQDEEVKAVVLRINSPGGSATASHLIEREVELLQQKKPVIVSMGDIAASGGYMIAAPAQRILAQPNTITGSIGVFGLLPNAQKLANSNGVTWDSLSTGPYANLYTIARPRTPAEMKLLQQFVDKFYADFVGIVAQGRKLTPAAVEQVAQGRVWSGIAAQRVKLVDELGGLETAIDRAVTAAALEEEDWSIAEYPSAPSLEEEIIDRLFGDVEISVFPESTTLLPPLQDLAQALQDDWKVLLEFSDPRQIYMRLPYQLNVE